MVPLAEIAERQFGGVGEVEVSQIISFLFLMGWAGGDKMNVLCLTLPCGISGKDHYEW